MSDDGEADSLALAQLAARCGIAAGFQDTRGKRHTTSDRTRRLLLAAMHFPAEGDPRTLLRELDEAEWRRPLPPVLVSRAGAAPVVRIALPAVLASRAHRWLLTAEDGASMAGDFVPLELPRAGQQRIGGVEFARGELSLPPLRSPGYYRLEIERAGHEAGAPAAMTLIVAPQACYQPAAVTGNGRVWGPTVQLYGLRSGRNWGIGDFTDLKTLVDLTADAGGGVVGVSPLHALFPDDPARISPYSPSSRCFLNILHLDVEAIPEFGECEPARRLVVGDRFQARLRRLRGSTLVSHAEVAAAKTEVLALLYRHFRERHQANDSERARAFRMFRDQAGGALEDHARFEALQAHFRGADAAVWGWPAWPADYRDPASPAVARFAAEHADAVGYYAWLQWLADEQLGAVGRQSWHRGLGVGLYQDLALGMSPGGSEAWRTQGCAAMGAHAGAPPDDFSLTGQDWGLPPFVPHRLRDAAYAPFIEVLRANMRHNGALRIDHAMALARLFWVPAGMAPEHGAYVDYPLDDLLGILALESQRNRCMVIGEDLGTVPEGFTARLAGAGVLSYRPFLFERADDGGFKPPARFPRLALAAASTHDLPTLRGFWQGTDLDTRQRLHMLPDAAERNRQVLERAQDRARVLMALEGEGLLPEGAGIHPVSVPDLAPPFILAIHAYLARSSARIVVVQPEDVFGELEQANLPGSRDDQHPNWCRRLPLDLESWRDDPRFIDLGEAMRRERGSAVSPHAAEQPPARRAIIPRATYRLQFSAAFTFRQATELVTYLAELGVSHCYASPYLKARPGSTHGYDIVDHDALNPEVGTAQEFEAFVAALKARGLGQILDVVPNHMGVMGADNAWWLDVLENGPASAWGAFFDIDWEPINPELHGKVLLPVLGDHYGTVLDRGELQLAFDAARGEFSLRYYQHRLPIDPATYPRIVAHRGERLAAALGEGHRHHVEVQSLLSGFGHLPGRSDTDPDHQAERQRDKEVHKRHLAALCAASPEIARHIAENLAEFNGRPGDAESFDLLHDLIRCQGYRLAFWRVAADEINYRRFFDINDLAALRMDLPDVFGATHRFVLELVASGKVDGLRIDHPDGLYDPGQYFRRVQEAVGGRPAAPGEALPLYLVIEKILADHERLPDDWPIHGATGYRFANLANNLFVDGSAGRRMSRVYRDFSGRDEDFDTLAYEAKKQVMQTALASQLAALATHLARIAAASRDTCDFTLNSLRDALVEVVACFPVYRSYVAPGQVSDDDRRHIAWAAAVARKRSPDADTGIHGFIEAVLTGDIARGRGASYRERVQSFAMRFQQFSSPVMAKGVEDTAFYRYHRLASLNDVGGEPRRFGVSVAAFHAATRVRAARWPNNLLATSTHDSKRSEDVRARLNVLSEMPAAWKLMLKRWRRLNRGRKRDLDGLEAPSRNDEYLLYQTLIGSWPLAMPDDAALADYRARIETYMVKALREAKEHSSWVNVNADYEGATRGFVQGLLAAGEKNLFLADFTQQVAPIVRHGLINALAQTLVKLASPGVPDIYQGCELWQFTLVDPDNRRPVDYAQRRQALAEVRAMVDAPPERWAKRLAPLVEDMADGRIKLHTICQALRLRGAWPEVFRDGGYLPVAVQGEHANHACAFARHHGARTVIALVPRLPARLLGDRHRLPLGQAVWGDTRLDLPPDMAGLAWRNVLTGETHAASRHPRLGDLLASFPVALLAAETNA